MPPGPGAPSLAPYAPTYALHLYLPERFDTPRCCYSRWLSLSCRPQDARVPLALLSRSAALVLGVRLQTRVPRGLPARRQPLVRPRAPHGPLATAQTDRAPRQLRLEERR